MSTNMAPYVLEIDMRTELQELFNGGEFVAKWEPAIIRQSIVDGFDNKIKCTCYNHETNEGRSDCPYCFGAGFLWKEIMVPSFRWSPREGVLSGENSYRSYGSRVGRLNETQYLMVVPYRIDIRAKDMVIYPKTDTNGGVMFPVLEKERFYISEYFTRIYDESKDDYTVIGLYKI